MHRRRAGLTAAGAAAALLLGAPHAAIDSPLPLCVSSEGIHCFARTPLAPLWQRLQGRTTYRPVAAGELLLAGGDAGLVAFAGDGAERWRLDDFGQAFSPSVAGDEVFFGTLTGALVGARLDGRVRWRRRFSGWMYSPAVFDSAVVSGGQAGVLYAVKRVDGNPLWERPLDQELVHGPLAVDRKALVVTTFAGTLAKVDARTGRVLWRHRFGVPSQTPVAVPGLLLCALFDGRVVALAAGDGQVQWEARLPGAVALAHAGNLLAAYNEEGLMLLNVHDGRVLREHGFPAPIAGAHWLDRQRIAVFLNGARNQVHAAVVTVSGALHQDKGDSE